MKHEKQKISVLASLVCVISLLPGMLAGQNADPNAVFTMHSTSDGSTITKRHESGSVVFNNKLYAFGGRQLKPIEFFDPDTNRWERLATPPFEIHHFQPVKLGDKIYAVGAFDCCYPREDIHPNVLIYDPANDDWSEGAAIPVDRLRGSAGAAVYNNKIYLVGGNTMGHDGGAVAWFDEFDPATNSWKRLPDAPNARDHFFAAVVGDKLVAASGRQSTLPNPFTNTVSAVDVYDFGSGEWSTGGSVIPTDRAGAMVLTFGDEVIYVGGEVDTSPNANTEVEAFNPSTGVWRALQPLLVGMHTGVAGVLGNELHVIAGSDKKGGGGENSRHQVALLDDGIVDAIDSDNDGLTDAEETEVWQTDRLDADSDNDNLSDGEEVNIHGSDPNQADSDDDGLSDFDEVALGTLLLDPDSDGDTLLDGEEVNIHQTDPLERDSDGDFLPDDHEVNIHNTDPNDADSDNDGLSDSEEVNTYSTNPLVQDTDNDGVPDNEEIEAGLDPLLADSDGDGVDDADELNGVEDTDSSEGESTDSGNTDSGSTDGGSIDGGSTDGGSTDSGSTDSGNTDSGSSDTGSDDTDISAQANSGGGSSGGGAPGLPLLSVMLLMSAIRAFGRLKVVSG